MKKAALLFFALLMLSAPVMADSPVIVKLSHNLPEDTPQHKGCLKFKELAESKSGNDIKVKIFHNQQIGTDQESVELMQTGVIQASLVPTAKLSRFDPTLQIADLPFLFPSKEICYCVLDSEAGTKLLAGLEKIGLKGVAVWESGFKQLTADRAIRKPEDYKGLKIRVMDSPILVEQFKYMGAKAFPIDFHKVYDALKEGIVNGQENPLASITKMKFYEVQPHMTLSYHGYLAYAFLFGKTFWDKLDTGQQKILKDAATEAAHYERELTAKMEKDFIKTIADSGTKIIRLTDEERKAFEKATRPVHKIFADTVGKEILEMVYAHIKECGK
ncbi:MAG: TRAP transporter substrate-binding protein [Desulfobacteraceae bacterium]|nr:TRAP transporter substrate-binding protein [Desulfobacteraceae bacterium]